MYRFHGPSTEPGNSSVSVLVHSGGLSLGSRNFRSLSYRLRVLKDMEILRFGQVNQFGFWVPLEDPNNRDEAMVAMRVTCLSVFRLLQPKTHSFRSSRN